MQALDITFYVLANKSMRPIELQKMLYLIEGISLIRTGKSIIDQKFAVKKFGPCIPSVYRSLKSFGANKIGVIDEKREQTIADVVKYLSVDKRQLIDEVLECFGNLAPWDLSYYVNYHHLQKLSLL